MARTKAVAVRTPKTAQTQEKAQDAWDKYHETGDIKLLKKAIKFDRTVLRAYRRAAKSRPNDTTSRNGFAAAGNLGVSLLDLYSKTGEEKALREAFELLQETLQLVPESNSFRPRAKVNLANAYRALYEHDGDASNLDQAITLHEEALQETPISHSTWDTELRQGHLVRCLIARGRQDDIARAMTLLSQSRSKKQTNVVADSDNPEQDMDADTSPPPTPISSFSSPPTREFELGVPIPDLTSSVKKVTEFPSSCGGFADIYMGEWDCRTYTTVRGKNVRAAAKSKRVAIKVIRRHAMDMYNTDDNFNSAHERARKRLRAEIRHWCGLCHPNVVQLLGTCEGFGPYTSMVCPWFANGNVSAFLRKHASLVYSERSRLIREVAEGLAYLHSNAIIHGDLTGANILVDDNHHACIADFGLSRLARDLELPSTSQLSSLGGALRWTAPELYSYGDIIPCVTLYSDIYSFGSIALEIFSGQLPYHYVESDIEVLLRFILHKKCPARPKGIEDKHWQAIGRCWSSDPKERPSSKALSPMFAD